MQVLEEFRDSIRSLEESLAIDTPAFLIDHSRWAKVHLTALHFPKNHVSRVLDVLDEVLRWNCPRISANGRRLITASRPGPQEDINGYPFLYHSRQPSCGCGPLFSFRSHRCEPWAGGKGVMNAIRSGTSLKDIYIHVLQPVPAGNGKALAAE